MIRRIFSTMTTFKELQFKAGLNVLLADKHEDATDRQTRNRAGKTSLVEIVHFLLGAECGPASMFRQYPLMGHTFGMDFDMASEAVTVLRSGEDHRNVSLHAADTRNWPVRPDTVGILSNGDWRALLGSLLFGLKPVGDDDKVTKWSPKFRQLFAYFARHVSGGAFSTPFKQSNMQQIGDQQVAMSFLLGLDWRISQEWQMVREHERTLRELKKAAGQQAFGAIIGTAADLRTRLAVAEERATSLRASVGSFRVLDEHPKLEAEASSLTIQIARLSDDNTIDRQLVVELEASFGTEAPPSLDDLSQVYQEAGVTLPGAVLRRFDDVTKFHESVIQNRKSYLANELEAARERIRRRISDVRALDERRAQVLSVLRAHGALDQFVQLQAELSRVSSESEALRHQLTAAEQLEGQKIELEIERAQLQKRLIQDFQERSDLLRQALVTFEEVSNALYEKAGSLLIRDSTNGPQFEVRIHGQNSKGISNMQIFCFDMTLMRLCVERNMGPGFLIHDSHLFDGVDERQIAQALQVGAENAERFGFQYIVTLNSDIAPTRALSNGFNVSDYVLPVKLTDDTETGGLYGVRFG
jgi:uncharacterized protein YydD (DUF2326 family)